jgi:hypothetical protein
MFSMLLLQGPIIYSLSSDCFVAHEFWAGTLIVLSLAAYGRGLVWLSVLSGLLALFLRELALPFVMVMLVLSIWEGHRREALAWFTGIMAFGVGFLVHWSVVTKLITENDRVMEGGWIAFGGWSFVLSTVQMHPYLLLMPLWVTALITPIVFAGPGRLAWSVERWDPELPPLWASMLLRFSLSGGRLTNIGGWFTPEPCF